MIPRALRPLALCSAWFLIETSHARAIPIYTTPESSPALPIPALMNATIDSLRSGLRSNHFTSVDLVEAYIRRIVEINDTVRAIAEINPDALEIAKGLDHERSLGYTRGPLHGIPILIKNNIATDDEMNTTAGSYALLGAKVPRDSKVVQRLREAGAIILGKTNLSQWAYFRSNNSSNGWSAQSGQVYGPFYPDQDPNGSSSGSAVAAILGLAAGALGTETDGSIISPASWNNVVGLKPTVGLTSRNLVIPISEHQDSVGPLTTTVKDAAIILQTIAGVDLYDNYTSLIPNNGSIPDYIAACNLSALNGARIGIPRNAIALRADSTFGPQLAAFEWAITVLESAGATIIDANFTSVEEYLSSPMGEDILYADFPVNLASYLALLTVNPNNITTLSELRKFTQSYPSEDFPDINTATWDEILFSQVWNNTDPRFWKAYQKNLYYGGEGGLLGAISRQRLDAIIMPANRSPTFASGTGAPALTVPLGVHPTNTTVMKNSRGMVTAGPNIPFGISFMGAKWTEAKLIGLAYAFEQKTKVRDQIHPYIAPKTDLKDMIKSLA